MASQAREKSSFLKVESAATDLLSPRAEIFRSKLIADFRLLDTITEGGSRLETPKHYSDELLNDQKRHDIIHMQPSTLMRFQMYSERDTAISDADRRKNRVKNKNTKNPPLDMWAHWVVESPWFQNIILALILINSISLGVQGELSDIHFANIEKVKLALEIFDYCTMWVFLLEILLKWCDNFWGFWHNRWNIFDFVITFLFFVPEVINFSSGNVGNKSGSQLNVIINNLRTFRVLRSLKMVSRFQKVRLIVLAVTKAFQAMVSIAVLMFIFTYIFAIIGVIFLKDGYKRFSTEELKYSSSFSNIGNAMITLFQLFTLDHWLDVYWDVTKVTNQLFSAAFVILWIIIGSFIFRNIFVGIMVNNFQSIRNDLFQEVEVFKERENRQVQIAEFACELERQNALKQEAYDRGACKVPVPKSADSIGLHRTSSRFSSDHELKEAVSDHVLQAEKDSLEWQVIVEQNLDNLAKEEAVFCWPKDSLFQYFLLMESLQENLKERQEMLSLASFALLQVHDS